VSIRTQKIDFFRRAGNAYSAERSVFRLDRKLVKTHFFKMVFSILAQCVRFLQSWSIRFLRGARVCKVSTVVEHAENGVRYNWLLISGAPAWSTRQLHQIQVCKVSTVVEHQVSAWSSSV